MNGKIVATNGRDQTTVKVSHWWPGRTWVGLPPVARFVINDWERRGSRYATVARAMIVDESRTATFLMADAVCCPKDVPDRKRGRAIALGRLGKKLAEYGWHLEAA